MNVIQQEQADSKKYFLSTISTDGGKSYLVELSHNNVALVEAMIRHDSDYSDFDNGKNQESSAYWLKELKKVLIYKTESKYKYSEILGYCIQYIDSENSTHLNADGIGRIQLTERLAKIDNAKLVEYLRNPEKEDYKLIEILSKKTEPEDNKHRARRNYSFATKFCHYACYHLFEGLPEQDNFSIYDSVVAMHIPEYANYFHISMPQDYKSNYKSYILLIDAIRNASKYQMTEEISRNGFDHLLWYFHKAR